MVIELVIAGYIVIFLAGVCLGNFWKPKPHCSGRLIVDETGETELWSFIMDDPIDNVKKQHYICLRIEKRQ